jgi:hypothetical protein
MLEYSEASSSLLQIRITLLRCAILKRYWSRLLLKTAGSQEKVRIFAITPNSFVEGMYREGFQGSVAALNFYLLLILHLSCGISLHDRGKRVTLVYKPFMALLAAVCSLVGIKRSYALCAGCKLTS